MVEMASVRARTHETNNENSASRIRKTGLSESMNSPADRILFLQRTIGNNAVQRLIKSGALQAKLNINPPGDIYEQEADRVARQVVSQINQPANKSQNVQRLEMPKEEEEEKLMKKPDSGSIQRQEIPKEDEEKLMKKEMVQLNEANNGWNAAPELENSIQQARGGGHALSDGIRKQIEHVLRTDFRGVKVHTDAHSDMLNHSLQARAFTTGNDIFFRRGEYDPGSSAGQELIAHELTHVVQQTGKVSKAVDQYERYAINNPFQQKKDNNGWERDYEEPHEESPILEEDIELDRKSIQRSPGISEVSQTLIQMTTATVPGNIKAPSTPATMGVDRIPPKKSYDYIVTVNDLGLTDQKVYAKIKNNNGGNGDVTINGGTSVELNNGANTLAIKGTGQTDTGKANNLALIVTQGTAELASTPGFSVAAIPQNWSVQYVSDIIESGKRGIKVLNSWESDSSDLTDLDKVKRKEVIERLPATGNQTNEFEGTPSEWRRADTGSIRDLHTLPSGLIQKGAGTKTTNQGFVFKDDRTNTTGVKATNSGFEIKKEVFETPGQRVKFTKAGKTVVVNGVTYDGGAGNASKELNA